MSTELDRLATNVGVVAELLTGGVSFGLLQTSLPGLREAVNRVMDDEDTERRQMVRYTSLLGEEFAKTVAECDEQAAQLRTAVGDRPCAHCGGTGWVR